MQSYGRVFSACLMTLRAASAATAPRLLPAFCEGGAVAAEFGKVVDEVAELVGVRGDLALVDEGDAGPAGNRKVELVGQAGAGQAERVACPVPKLAHVLTWGFVVR